MCFLPGRKKMIETIHSFQQASGTKGDREENEVLYFQGKRGLQSVPEKRGFHSGEGSKKREDW